ncbi:hypothetical protein BMS3Abin04_02786 [bacterium BMS3Abin04]|nr:hypothetical protein BMS3Abin04_02786 [bacterium BMS3Abin04]
MKKLFLFFLLISVTAKAQFNFVESHPADGAVNVQLADTISVTFSAALDTSVQFHDANFLITNVGPITQMWFSNDLTTIYLTADLAPDYNYFMLFYGLRSQDGSKLELPVLIEFTTDSVFNGYNVSGTVSFEDSIKHAKNAFVALLPHPLNGGEPDILHGAIIDSNGNFSVDHVPDGIYYPIAAVDVNGDGMIDPGMGDYIGSADSVVVSGGDVNNVNILAGKEKHFRFDKVRAIIDSLRNGNLPPNIRLYFVNAWQSDTLGHASEWQFYFVSTLFPKGFVINVFPEGHSIDTMDVSFFNWVSSMRPLADSISAAALPDSFVAKIERKAGRAFRRQQLPDSLSVEMVLSLGQLAKDGFDQLVPDQSAFYWGLRYRVVNRYNNSMPNTPIPHLSLNKTSEQNEQLYIANYKTGEPVNVTGVDENGKPNLPKVFSLEQNYPNPFNPSTIIKYQVPNSGYVSLKIYDVLGEEVSSLVNKEQAAGSYEISFNASNLTSGIYFYQLKSGNNIQVKKMMLLK